MLLQVRLKLYIVRSGEHLGVPSHLLQHRLSRRDAFRRVSAAKGTYWHNGATGGYSSFAFFNPKEDYAGVVLLNTTVSASGSYADLVGQHVAQRLRGQPAVSLGN
jgi:CubicO group peptidase (beta-lactamase class C family)